ncbi:MAG: PLP-dependent lyase/thiolase [Candidatus Paceibacterota bacterium]|jgi:threonine synthase
MSPTPITPQTDETKLASALGIAGVFLKREDLHPYGSHKGRSIPMMIDIKSARGGRDFAISSSGNAALAAIRHVQKKNAAGADLSLSVLIGENIHPDKKAALLAEIQDEHVELVESKRPLQMLLEKIRGEQRLSLRQSTDFDALVGYKELAQELALIPNLSAVFMGTSSGTSAQALAQFFRDKKMPVAVHIVQTTQCFPIAGAFYEKPDASQSSIADAIVDKIAYRRDALVPAIRNSGGSGWIASDNDIQKAQALLEEHSGVIATPNGALGLAGLMKAVSHGIEFTGPVACIVTGR